jgi:hypothetical protein
MDTEIIEEIIRYRKVIRTNVECMNNKSDEINIWLTSSTWSVEKGQSSQITFADPETSLSFANGTCADIFTHVFPHIRNDINSLYGSVSEWSYQASVIIIRLSWSLARKRDLFRLVCRHNLYITFQRYDQEFSRSRNSWHGDLIR